MSAQFDQDRKLAATAIFRLGEVYRKQGRTNEAVAQYERIVREFSDQPTLVTLSRQNLAGLGTRTTSFSDRLVAVVPRGGTAASDAAILNKLKGLSQAEARQLLPTLLPDELLNTLLAQYQSAEAARAGKGFRLRASTP